MSNEEWSTTPQAPPPLFVNQKERDFVFSLNKEVAERIVGQRIIYYPIDLDRTNFHDIYGEAIIKTFLNPVHVFVFVEWEGVQVTVDSYGVDKRTSLKVHFPKRRITEDQDLFVRIGDFLTYDNQNYEITTLDQPRELFGQFNYKVEVVATCKKAPEGLFDAC